MKNTIITILGISTVFLMYTLFSESTNSLTVYPILDEECKSPIAVYEDPTRIPLRNFVLDYIGDLHDKSIVDIGAGPGFFAFEMALSAHRVYATELDPMFLTYMEDKKTSLNLPNFEVVKAYEQHDELTNLQFDYALMVFVFHYL